MFLEHDDLYQAGGHSHIQIGRQADRAAGRMPLEPRGAAGLATRLGAQHPRLRDDRDGDHRRDAARLRLAGCRDACCDERWIDAAPPFDDGAFPRRVSAAGQALPFRARLGARSGPTTRACRVCPTTWPAIDEATPDRPFRLVTAPARSFLNTSFTETPSSRKREGRPTALMHPEDAARAGHRRRRPGAARQRARRGRAACAAVPTDCSRASWWRRASGRTRLRRRHRHQRADQRRSRPAEGGAVFHDTAVWLRAAAVHWRGITHSRRSNRAEPRQWPPLSRG